MKKHDEAFLHVRRFWTDEEKKETQQRQRTSNNVCIRKKSAHQKY